MKSFIVLFLVFIFCTPLLAAERPNILIIVADDLGYSDIGEFGGEIETPNLDALVRSGMRMNAFYAGASCAPTRSMLLSGTDHHLAGVGTQGRRVEGHPGYASALNARVVSLAKILQDNNYHTYMTGKWHLGSGEEQRPLARGFERSFSLMQGGASHFGDGLGLFSESADYWEDDRKVEQLPSDFFSSAFYTDKMLNYIESSVDDDKPFFGYMAYTAPHWPLQAPDEWLRRYKGKYDVGWDVIREQRIIKQKQLGLYSEDAAISGRPDHIPAWQSLSPVAKKVEAKRMENYASMVANLDHHIGRVMNFLRERDELENTLILFFSDNGAEGNDMGVMGANEYWLPARFDNRLDNMGKINSYVWQGQGWAHVSALPFRMYKTYTSDGGIHVPAVFSWPGTVPANTENKIPVTVMDVLPTVLDVAAIKPVGNQYDGRDVLLPLGRSLAALLKTNKASIELQNREFGWESYGNRGYRRGDWKIIWLWPPFGPGRWELFNLASDPGETMDLSAKHPDLLNELSAAWNQWAEDLDVIIYDGDIGYGR